jgi:hypothetical protein
MLLQAYPKAAEVQDKYGDLPLHLALEKHASDDVIKMLLIAYLNAAQLQNKYGNLPFDIALKHKASDDVIKMILIAYPKAAQVQNNTGWLPLHYALKYNASNDVIEMLLHTYPQAARVKDNTGTLPLSIAKSCHASDDVIKMLIEAQQEFITTPSITMSPTDSNEQEKCAPEQSHILEQEKTMLSQPDPSTLSEGYKEESISEPILIHESKICIENHTTYILHVTIHGENEIQTVVGPKQGDECMRTYLTIQGDFACVTIQNNAYRELCCGWGQKFIINRGSTHLVQGEPYLRIKDDCRHV